MPQRRIHRSRRPSMIRDAHPKSLRLCRNRSHNANINLAGQYKTNHAPGPQLRRTLNCRQHSRSRPINPRRIQKIRRRNK